MIVSSAQRLTPVQNFVHYGHWRVLPIWRKETQFLAGISSSGNDEVTTLAQPCCKKEAYECCLGLPVHLVCLYAFPPECLYVCLQLCVK